MAIRSIKLGHSAVPETARAEILKVFDSGFFSPGKKVKLFEETFARAHEAKHAIFVNSGTDALRLSLLALKEQYGWRDGDQVAVPTVTFVATVNVILQANLTPLFVDVGMHDYLINPWNLEHKLDCAAHPRLKAVMPVHLFGQSCTGEIYKLSKRLKLKVVEDSCETILNPIRGDVSCHSTYMAHHITTGVGGFALTNNDTTNQLIRSLANHGRNTNYIPGYKMATDISKRFQFDRIGYSSRGTEFEAALGLAQMPTLQDVVLKRQLIATHLERSLKQYPDLVLPEINVDSQHTFMMFPIVIHEKSHISKKKMCQYLENNGIETRDMMPITNQPCYKGLLDPNDYPMAKWINENGFYIACHEGLTRTDIEYIHGVFDRYLKKK